MARRILTASFVTAALAARLLAAGDPYDIKATEEWRVQREARLRTPDGWLSVAGLFFLKSGANTVGSDSSADIVLPPGSAPPDVGQVSLEAHKAYFEPRDGVVASVNGSPAQGRVELRLADPEHKRAADRLTIGRVWLQLHNSGERLAMRLRDPENPLRTGFTGVRWYPIDPAWRLTGRFVPHATPHTVPVQNVLGDTEDSMSPGEVEITIAGKPVRLLALEDDGRLWFVFTDQTADRDTYRIRFLYTPMPDASGSVTLDFNRTQNPPCAYNPYTTCPLPPPQNRLKVAIPAGEQKYVNGDSPHLRK
jgi:uncharacterized protein